MIKIGVRFLVKMHWKKWGNKIFWFQMCCLFEVTVIMEYHIYYSRKSRTQKVTELFSHSPWILSLLGVSANLVTQTDKGLACKWCDLWPAAWEYYCLETWWVRKFRVSFNHISISFSFWCMFTFKLEYTAFLNQELVWFINTKQRYSWKERS